MDVRVRQTARAKSTTLIRSGRVIDGSGGPARRADVLICGDRIADVGTLHPSAASAADVIDADGLVVAPGFINILSHAYATLQQDPRGASDILQGVTTEIFGEGVSGGPVCGRMPDHFPLDGAEKGVRLFWPTLAGFLGHLEARGVGPNVASLVGFSNLRLAITGYDNRQLNEAEVDAMASLLADELAEGALGLGSALIYPPDCYSSTAELITLARVLRQYDALYASHVRSEGGKHLAAVHEVLDIVSATSVRAHIYHLKSLGLENWHAFPRVLADIEEARARGAEITADIYPYDAAGTSVQTALPQEFLAGGHAALVSRLRNPTTRAEVREQMLAGVGESMFRDAGGATGMMLLGTTAGYETAAGRRISDVAAERQQDPIDVIFDLVERDPQLMVAYFGASETNTRMAYARPWVSVSSDAEAVPTESPFLDVPVHPRAYGSFARVLGTYTRQQGIVRLEEAVRKMTSLPADTLRLSDRGRILPGAFADIAVFDANRVEDRARYDQPHQYAAGMVHVFVNGVAVVRDGKLTGQLGGRALRRSPHRPFS